jgi:Cupredoxin-like domain
MLGKIWTPRRQASVAVVKPAVARSLILVLGVAFILAGLFVLLRPNKPAEGPQTREFDPRISGRGMEPSNITVTQGDRVVLNVTADSPREIHLHGYDIEREVGPGEPARLSFEADLSGRFTIEDHETEEELGTLVVRPR